MLFSGLTVGIGLLALEVLPVPFLRATGVGGVLVPVISVAVAITLLPVVLAVVGPKLDWPRIRTDGQAGRGWLRWVRFTVRRKTFAAIGGALVMTALMLPAPSLHTGEPSSAALAQAVPAHLALSTLQSGGVPSGTLTPITVQTEDSQADATAAELARIPGVHVSLAPAAGGNRAAGTALVTVLPTAETNVGVGLCSSWPGCARPTTPANPRRIQGAAGVGGPRRSSTSSPPP